MLFTDAVKSCREGQKWACSLVYWSPLPDCWLFQDCAIGLLFALLPVLGGNSQLFQGIISMARLLLVLSLFLTVASILSWSFVPSFLKLMIQLSSQACTVSTLTHGMRSMELKIDASRRILPQVNFKKSKTQENTVNTSTLGMESMKLKTDTDQRALQQVRFKKFMTQVNMVNI
ncbi:hypothetical protein MRB53_023533 [Persea americana]|uniref:Uncharacterized protein n=1 Tax=Persea americana TaxID=3435 RepID=A0ACC2L9V4_PERAE|nr:hypothetical protein MRB53_023533 [Persea americana]